VPKLTYSNLRFQNFLRGETPDPVKREERGLGRGVGKGR